MPPAFNLSQDQTLQLNPDRAAVLLSLKVNEVHFLRALDALTFSSSAHTYRLRIFKERWLRGEDLNL